MYLQHSRLSGRLDLYHAGLPYDSCMSCRGFPFLKVGILLAAVGLGAFKIAQAKNIQVVVKEKDDKKEAKKGLWK